MLGVVLVSTREENRSRKHIKRESEKRGKKDPELNFPLGGPLDHVWNWSEVQV